MEDPENYNNLLVVLTLGKPTAAFTPGEVPIQARKARQKRRELERGHSAMACPPSAPVTQQICSTHVLQQPEPEELREAAQCLVVDADGKKIPFRALYGERKAIVVFVRNFLCYTCKEYVEDLAKVPKSFLEDANVRLIVIGQSSYHHIKPFCSLTGYTHEMYVDPQREIYKILGMKRGEGNNIPGTSGNEVHFLHLDKHRLDHAPINTVLQLAGIKTVDFSNKSQIIDI